MAGEYAVFFDGMFLLPYVLCMEQLDRPKHSRQTFSGNEIRAGRILLVKQSCKPELHASPRDLHLCQSYKTIHSCNHSEDSNIAHAKQIVKLSSKDGIIKQAGMFFKSLIEENGNKQH